MINLRYHIVSITAVFLALGIGVTLGSSLIQRYTIDTLETRLDELGERLDRTDGENRELRDELRARDEFDERLGEDARVLFGGHLEEAPVLVLAAQGTDDELLEDTRDSLRRAGADVSGLLLVTSRWDELSEGEVEELSALFGRRFSNDRIARTTVLRRLAAELVAATDEPPVVEVEPPIVGEQGEGGEGAGGEGGEAVGPEGGEAATPPEAPEVPAGPGAGEEEGAAGEPDLGMPVEEAPPVPGSEVIPLLVGAGYLEFRPERAATPLPAYGLRIVVIDDPRSSLEPDRVLLPLLESMAVLRSEPLPLVVAGPIVETADPDRDDDTPILEPSPLVAAVRAAERLTSALSTVDDARTFPGQAALVLSLSEHGGRGHFGRAAGAEALLPAGVP